MGIDGYSHLFRFHDRLAEEKKASGNIYYNFDQYLYEANKGAGEGIGLFGRSGASDGNPNFMHCFYSLGIGGKGVIWPFQRPVRDWLLLYRRE
jgi:hypothetical protein